MKPQIRQLRLRFRDGRSNRTYLDGTAGKDLGRESLVPNGRVIGPIAEGGWALGSIKSGGPKHPPDRAFRLLRALLRSWCDRQVGRDEEATDAITHLPNAPAQRVHDGFTSSLTGLHEGRTAYVSADEIVSAVSTWLAELGAHIPFVEDLARAVRNGYWVVAHPIADRLSVDVAVAA